MRNGLGFEWALYKQLRVNFEISAIATRTLEVEARGHPKPSEMDGRPSAYFVISLELRP